MKIDFTQNIIEFDEIDSTNDYLKINYSILPNYTVVKTKFQTNGHGQFGRTWESSFNENLLFSILIKDSLPFEKDDINPILVSSILKVLEDLNINAYFKHPNDIYVNNKKLAGILIETKYDSKRLEYMIIGIGMNINQTNFINENAISLKQILNQEVEINKILIELLKQLKNSIQLRRLMNLGEKYDN